MKLLLDTQVFLWFLEDSRTAGSGNSLADGHARRSRSRKSPLRCVDPETSATARPARRISACSIPNTVF
jgi:hypothetical protein